MSDDDNPYQSPATDTKTKSSELPPGPPSPWRSALTGATWSVVSTFPIAAITASLFRFPVPFAGYLSGINAVLPAMVAVLIYGVLLGGFVLLGVLGAIGGLVAATTLKFDQPRCAWVARLWALLVSTTSILILAFLDKIIGPW